MSNWPVMRGTLGASQGLNFANSRAQILDRPSTTYEWGGWTEIAVLPFDVDGIHVNVSNSVFSTAGNGPNLVELGIGGSGHEVNLFGPTHISKISGVPSARIIVWVPFALPAGTRISARQFITGGAPHDTYVNIIPQRSTGSFPKGMAPRCSTYGLEVDSTYVDTIELTASAANNWGPWIEITSATDRSHAVLYVSQVRSTSMTSRTNHATMLVRIGAGSLMNEQPLVMFPATAVSNTLLGSPNFVGPFFVDVPSGTRLSASMMMSASPYVNGVHLVAI